MTPSLPRAADINVGTAYGACRERITAMVTARPDLWGAAVPHCPEWTVRQTIAHLAGIVDDAANGNLAGAGTDPWTAVQVAKRENTSMEAILAEWTSMGPFFEGVIAERGLATAQPLFDIATHEHDLRHCLGVPDAQTTDVMTVGNWFLCSRLNARLAEASRPPVRVIIDGFDATAEFVPDISSTALTVRASAFDFIRCFGSRRTKEQMLALDWSGDLAAVFDKLTPFGYRTTTIDEG
jgi:uncharacterized protein (TIGR03083 family)